MGTKRLGRFIILFLLLLRLVKITPPFHELLRKDYNYEALKELYYSSQYVLEKPKGAVPDNAIYSFAAGYYLRGGSPIIVDPSQPPLGKYLLALSVYFFKTTKPATYLFFYLTLITFFLLSKYVLGRTELALLTAFVFSFEKNFINQLRYTPMLDIFQLCFIIFAFYFFIKWVEEKKTKNLVLASLSLGAVAAIKFFITALVIFIGWVAFLALKKRWQDILKLSISVALATYLILTLSYLRVLLEEPNPLKVLGIQKWILWYHQSKLTSLFTIWPLIYFNRWQTWWGDFAIIEDSQWWFIWPILFTISFITLLLYAIKKLKVDKRLEAILIWFLTYSILISLAQASSRYLIPILPFLYLISVKSLILVWYEIKNKKI